MRYDNRTRTHNSFKASHLHQEGGFHFFLNLFAMTLSEIWNFSTPKGTVWTQTHWEESIWDECSVSFVLFFFFNLHGLVREVKSWNWDCVELCVWSLWMCMITIRVILLVFGLAGALSVSILLSVELILSHVLLCRSCKTGDTTLGYTLC